jgi:hypothetical protein
MTRLLPCTTPSCRPIGAMLPPNPAYPNGEPYLSGQYVDRYVCARCGNNIKITAADYHAQKVLTLSDFERLADKYASGALARLPLRDLIAAGIPEKQRTKAGGVSPAADLFAAGIRTAHDVAELERE